MKVKNNSARVWTVGGVICVPGQTTVIPNGDPNEVKGNPELELVKGVEAQDVEFTEKTSMTANEIKAELDAKGIEYKTNMSKAELQALLDEAE